MRFTCGDCPARWTGLGRAHCAACHQTFTTVGNFDKHRRGGGCREPVEIGMVRRPNGLWGLPGAPDEPLLTPADEPPF